VARMKVNDGLIAEKSTLRMLRIITLNKGIRGKGRIQTMTQI